MSSTKTAMVLRIQTLEGMKRVPIDDSSLTVAQLKSSIQTALAIPEDNQTLSTNLKLLEAKNPEDRRKFTDMSNPNSSLSDLNLCHGSVLYLFDTRSMDPKMIIKDNHNHNQKGGCSGTVSSFKSEGPQILKDSIFNTGVRSGNYRRSDSAGASERQHGDGGTKDSFISRDRQDISNSRFNTGEDAGDDMM